MTASASRRRLLQAAAVSPVLLAAACGSDGGSSPSDPDGTVRSTVADSEQELIARYSATIAKFGTLAAKLQPIQDQHTAHLQAMGVNPDDVQDQKAPDVPATAAAAVAALVQDERKAAKARVEACSNAANADLVWQLTLIAASESQHAAALAGVRA